MGLPWRLTIAAALAAFLQPCLGSLGDLCYILGQNIALVDDEIFFIGGNLSFVALSGQDIEHTSDLYWLNLTSNYPVEQNIPYSTLNNATIDPSITGAVDNAEGSSNLFNPTAGALFNTKDTLLVYGGLESNDASDVLAAYDIPTQTWSNVTVSGGNFNQGNRYDGLWTSVADTGMSFFLGGRAPYTGPSLLRLDASNPSSLSWTNESLGDGSYGVEVPNLGGGSMVYIPAGEQGMLIAFGGYNVSSGISPDSGWPYDAEMSQIGVYDIASHTWWWQTATGNVPGPRGAICSVVAAAPDNSAFHITMYGGWSLFYQRSYEDVYVLSIPSFTWIDVTDVASKSSQEQQVNSTIGRDGMRCSAYQGSQMIVLGGNVRAGIYSVSDGACSNVFAPSRVLDLSTYQWETALALNATYSVPSAIANVIGGDSTGGATKTAPQGGFADKTLSKVLQQRAPTPTTTNGASSDTTISSQGSSTPTPSGGANSSSNSSSTAAIAGGVVGGVAGAALVVAGVFYLIRRRRRWPKGSQTATEDKSSSPETRPEHPQELHANHRPFELEEDRQLYELPNSQHPAELPGSQQKSNPDVRQDSVAPR